MAVMDMHMGHTTINTIMVEVVTLDPTPTFQRRTKGCCWLDLEPLGVFAVEMLQERLKNSWSY